MLLPFILLIYYEFEGGQQSEYLTDAGVKVPALKSTQSKAPNVPGSSSCEQSAL